MQEPKKLLRSEPSDFYLFYFCRRIAMDWLHVVFGYFTIAYGIAVCSFSMFYFYWFIRCRHELGKQLAEMLAAESFCVAITITFGLCQVCDWQWICHPLNGNIIRCLIFTASGITTIRLAHKVRNITRQDKTMSPLEITIIACMFVFSLVMLASAIWFFSNLVEQAAVERSQILESHSVERSIVRERSEKQIHSFQCAMDDHTKRQKESTDRMATSLDMLTRAIIETNKNKTTIISKGDGANIAGSNEGSQDVG